MNLLLLKTLFNKPESVLLLRNFINKNKIIKNHFVFNLNTIFYNSSTTN